MGKARERGEGSWIELIKGEVNVGRKTNAKEGL